MAITPIAFDVEHRSEEWRALRCGLVTASRCCDVAAITKKGEEGAARRHYRAEVISERLTNIPADLNRYVSREMQWGIDKEPFARAAYEMMRDVMVDAGGFVTHPTLANFGASPDGLVGLDGLVQIKCPNTSTHLEWKLEGVVPVEHATQMLAELACTGRQWNDFVSFDPRLPEHMQLFVRRLYRDDKLIALLEGEVAHFNAEIDYILGRLNEADAVPF